MNKSVSEQFQEIIHHLIGSPYGHEPMTRINISHQFDPKDQSAPAIIKNLNAAFLIALAGASHPRYDEAQSYLTTPMYKSSPPVLARFLLEGLKLVPEEVTQSCVTNDRLRAGIDHLCTWFENPSYGSLSMDTLEKTRAVFFPEGVGICTHREEMTRHLRKKRTVTISRLNTTPIKNPFGEILFTSNILLTLPPHPQSLHKLSLGKQLQDKLSHIAQEEQVYWYDHPVQIGVRSENNEVIYGLKGLDSAIAFEKQRGTCSKDQILRCILSVSVTHNGLHAVAKEYLQESLKEVEAPQSLCIHLFTEDETKRLVENIVIPAANRYLQNADSQVIHEIVGVDGEYGRHYSFLKAVSAFWHVLIDPSIRGTFKIDLDQVFPQEELVRQGGASAFGTFTTPLWGAEGTDDHGDPVELGMIAGSLVNEKDIATSLFSPDVCYPPQAATGDELVFFSTLPQALSTEAEMMTRYAPGDIDGNTSCLQRIHVTGGTCGILVESLRRHRPFTPTFIGRAEDQAYLLSVLFNDQPKHLRYVHKDGLIMRHDKEAFAGEAMRTAYIGKVVGDYARILWFSAYAQALPWPLEKTKDLVDPFTGCFISEIPITLVYLRLALKAASLFATDGGQQKGLELLSIGARRLSRIIQYLNKKPNPLIKQYKKEQQGWDVYYDVLDQLEAALKRGDVFARDLQEKARALVEDSRMKV